MSTTRAKQTMFQPPAVSKIETWAVFDQLSEMDKLNFLTGMPRDLKSSQLMDYCLQEGSILHGAIVRGDSKIISTCMKHLKGVVNNLEFIFLVLNSFYFEKREKIIANLSTYFKHKNENINMDLLFQTRFNKFTLLDIMLQTTDSPEFFKFLFKLLSPVITEKLSYEQKKGLETIAELNGFTDQSKAVKGWYTFSERLARANFQPMLTLKEAEVKSPAP